MSPEPDDQPSRRAADTNVAKSATAIEYWQCIRPRTFQAQPIRECEAKSCWGTSGAHQREICPEAPRTAEISSAAQMECQAHRPRSEAVRHKTRPTGRLAAGQLPLRRLGLPAGRPSGRRWRGTSRGTRDREIPAESARQALSAMMFMQVAAVQQGSVPLVMTWLGCELIRCRVAPLLDQGGAAGPALALGLSLGGLPGARRATPTGLLRSGLTHSHAGADQRQPTS